jgi:hypothetical protein
MSLKEITKEVFTRYGLNEEDISVYIKYLGVPQATISEVLMYFEEGSIEYSRVEEITNKLVENNFLKKIEGIVDRYVPLEPYFELFTNESEVFRNEIASTKDNALADQSSRFEKLESIQNKSIEEVENAVATQVKAFFDDSDAKDSDKKARIDKATNQFTETSKTLEKKLHDNIEKDYSELKADVDQLDGELEVIKEAQNTSTGSLENNIHNILDTLNTDLKNISSSFVSDNESAITTANNNLNSLVAELLGDFSSRVENLEKELKKDLDDHVERHKNIANELKPKMEQILEKYLERMEKIITDLKERISKLLSEHINQVKGTTSRVESDIHSKVENRQLIFQNQVNEYKNSALTLLENLLDTSNRFSDFSEAITKVGFFFGKKKKMRFINDWKVIEQKVASISRPFKDDFVNDCDKYINDTQSTTDELKGEVTETMSSENSSLTTETSDLDKRAQETISAELDTLATDMASEIDDTLQSGVKDCSDTTVKLKDSLENTLKQHHRDYDEAINNHKEQSLKHYTAFDSDIKTKNDNWVKDVDSKFSGGKSDVSTECNNQITTINDFKSKHKNTVDSRLAKIRSDFDSSKSITSEKIDSEINLWNGESADMDKMLSNMLEDHKNKYKENAETLRNSLSNTTRDTSQNVKDAIADFTLHFMNSIDDVTEIAETNETKLKDIHNASSSVQEDKGIVNTWHTVGREALIAAVKSAVYRTKSSIIIVMPKVIPEILQLISEFAYQKKAARFMLTSAFDMATYGDIIKKMMLLGNIQFRNLTGAGDFFAVTRDAEEVILAPVTTKETEMVAIISNQEQYSKLYSQIIGPVFQANSRPIKL